MPQINAIEEAQLIFIDTEIGRGHPGYLDGTIARVAAVFPHLRYHRTDVFAVSRGLSMTGWRAVRWLYRMGGKGGLVTSLYGLMRRSSGAGRAPGLLLTVLGRDLSRFTARAKGILVVSHPILAQMLAPLGPVVYQHGELAVPDEALVNGCRRIFVPWREGADDFKRFGTPVETLAVTGQCIENELVDIAVAAHEARMERLQGNGPLTVALFSSGAYPPLHLRRLCIAARSLAAAGHTSVIFAGQSRPVAKSLLHNLHRRGIPAVDGLDLSAGISIVGSPNRNHENRLTAELFPRLDLFVAPAHERTNWAVGLGLPQFILCPHIGSYAPGNAAIATGRGVALEIPDDRTAQILADLIADLRQTGRLAEMAAGGFGQTDIDGFDRSARLLADLVDEYQRERSDPD